MKDRYLFKGKRVDNGEWVEGHYIYDGVTGKSFIHQRDCEVNESEKVGEEGCLRLFAFEIDPSTICQNTGRGDEWENDIFDEDDDRYVISYDKDNVLWLAVSVCSSESIELGEFNNEYYVKVGNAIDNPELLEVENEIN